MSSKLELIGVMPGPAQRGPPPIHPAMLRTRSRICRAMIAAHALAPEQAIQFNPGPSDVAELMRLRKAGVMRETIAGHYWCDLVANFQREQQTARVRAMWGFGIALTLAALVMTLYFVELY